MDDDTALDEVWADDLFGRQAEAALLIGYLESVAGRVSMREDAHGFTLALDARYGEGKSFFLRRLAVQLERNHPVAFVDAWTDDLADEPLTALAATLKRALDPLIARSPAVGKKFDAVLEKTGQIVKIVGGGLIKRGIGLAITGAAAEALEGVFSDLGDTADEAVKDKVKSAGDDLVGDAVTAFGTIAPGKLMEERIAAFARGQAAIEDMRASLASLVASLAEDANLRAPIFIIIDELDRCRPTYAVKLLEEIKHLFDVPGLVFILGLHGDQLAHSVTAAYGAQFDGKAYLRRFFHRHYRLAEPDLKLLLAHLCRQAGISDAKAQYFQFTGQAENRKALPLPDMMARYMSAYGMPARSAFEIVDILQTCFALADGSTLYLNYLLPLIIGHVEGLPEGELPPPARATWQLFKPTDHLGREGTGVGPEVIAEEFKTVSAWPRSNLSQLANRDVVSPVVRAVYETGAGSEQEHALHAVRNYPKLLATVSRFKNPVLKDD